LKTYGVQCRRQVRQIEWAIQHYPHYIQRHGVSRRRLNGVCEQLGTHASPAIPLQDTDAIQFNHSLTVVLRDDAPSGGGHGHVTEIPNGMLARRVVSCYFGLPQLFTDQTWKGFRQSFFDKHPSTDNFRQRPPLLKRIRVGWTEQLKMQFLGSGAPPTGARGGAVNVAFGVQHMSTDVAFAHVMVPAHSAFWGIVGVGRRVGPLGLVLVLVL